MDQLFEIPLGEWADAFVDWLTAVFGGLFGLLGDGLRSLNDLVESGLTVAPWWLMIALLGLLALFVGSIIRHSAGGITIMIGLVLAPLVLALFMATESLHSVRDFLFEYSFPSQLGVFYDSTLSGSGPRGWDPLWIMLGLAAVAGAGAYALLRNRDV